MRTARTKFSHDESSFIFSNLEIDGGILRWKNGRGTRYDGKSVGTINSRGYLTARLNGRTYQVHRIIFYMSNGYLPLVVDHINRIKTDNRPENLRGCTQSENTLNSAIRSDNRTGKAGISFRGDSHKWRAQLWVNSIKVLDKTFEKRIHAEIAYDKARDEYVPLSAHNGYGNPRQVSPHH